PVVAVETAVERVPAVGGDADGEQHHADGQHLHARRPIVATLRKRRPPGHVASASHTQGHRPGPSLDCGALRGWWESRILRLSSGRTLDGKPGARISAWSFTRITPSASRAVHARRAPPSRPDTTFT